MATPSLAGTSPLARRLGLPACPPGQPEQEAPLTVIGGVGGTTARLEDLDRCAKALDLAALALSSAGATLARMQATLDQWGNPLHTCTPEEVTAAAAARVARGVLEIPRTGTLGVETLRGRIVVTAERVRSARKEYAKSESLATRVWNWVWNPPSMPLFPFPTMDLRTPLQQGIVLRDIAAWRSGGGDVPAHTFQELIRNTAHRTNPFMPDDPVPWFAGTLGAAVDVMSPPSKVRADPVIGSRRHRERSDGVGDLVTELSRVAASKDSVVEIDEVRRSDGSKAWSIKIPGTKDWGANSSSPFDTESNLDLMAGKLADSTVAVLAAMRQAGIGKDEPVLLTGHSQGGMVAQQVASRGGFAVAGVLTVGSPVDGSAMKATAPTLSIAHRTDVVPSADGKEPVDSPLHTTVLGEAEGDVGSSVTESHELWEYEKLAREVDAEDHASIHGWKESLDEVFGDAKSVRSRSYRLTSVPVG